jgi:hypothetical protein
VKAIWKFPIATTDAQLIPMPVGARLLTVQTQDESPCIWAEVSPAAEPVDRIIYVHGTGHTFDHDASYLGTYQVMGGMLIFHVYDGGEAGA